jgi:hypothetical protein
VNDDRTPDDIDALLTELAERALDRAGAGRPATAPARVHARAYEASCRRTRQQRMASAAVLVLVVAVMASSLVSRGAMTEIFAGLGDTRSGTTVADPTGSVPGTGTTTPGGDPTPATSMAPGSTVVPAEPEAGPPAGDAPPPDPVNPDAPLQIRPDGLGLVRFDQDYASAMAALTAALGPPDEAGAPYHPGGCLPTQQSARWGDLKIWFIDLGAGQMFTSYTWGNANLLGGGSAPAGPGTPAVGNPWGYQLGMTVPSYDAVVSRLRRDYPEARRDTGPGVIPYASVPLGPRVLKIGLDDTSRIARFWVFDGRLIDCR